MDKRFLCVFDLDGTFYPKESNITFEMRNRVISYIAQILDISYHEAELKYRELPKTFPNPYDGLKSLGISGIEYQKIFDSIDVNNYMQLDSILRDKLCELSLISDIYVVSFAPNNYVSRMINALGISSYIQKVYSVNENTNYSKIGFFE